MGSPTMEYGTEVFPKAEAPLVQPPSIDTWTAELDAVLLNAVFAFAGTGESRDWKVIAARVGHGKTDKAAKRRFNIIDPTIKKGRWSADEDELLLYYYNVYPQQWSNIAAHIPGRRDEQVAKRWRDTLDPSLQTRDWTEEEDAKLLALYAELGPHWTGICAQLDGRSGMMARNRHRKLVTRAAGPRRRNSRSASRERSNSTEAGPSRIKRTSTSTSLATSRSLSPASPRTRPIIMRQSSSSSSAAGSVRPVSPFDPHQYYAALASPVPLRAQSPQQIYQSPQQQPVQLPEQQHFPPVLDTFRPQASSSSAFTEAELAFMRSYPPTQERSDSIDWTELHGFVPPSRPIPSAPAFPSPLSQAPLTQGYTVCSHCHGHGMVPSVTNYSTSAPPTGYFDPPYLATSQASLVTSQASLAASLGSGLKFP